MKIITGKIKSAQKVVLYGPEGIGKSTFASKFPNALFIDTEGSTKHLDVARTPTPTSWSMLMGQVEHIKNNPDLCDTLVIDTADWAEQLAIDHICAKAGMAGIEDWGYGKGYTYLAEEFGRLLNLLNDVISAGVNVCMTAHAHIKKFEQPDEMGAYDRWELKLQRRTAPLVKEWADMVLFANYQTIVVVDDSTMGKSRKAQGGKRVMYTSHHPAWDAKNRHDLPEELPLDFAKIADEIPIINADKPAKAEPKQEPAQPKKETKQTKHEPEPKKEPKAEEKPNLPKALLDLMEANNVTTVQIQEVVAAKGYYPENTPIENYDPEFVEGVLVAAWDQVYREIQENSVPF